MKKGDKVRFLSEVGGGKVTGFQGKNIVLVEDEDGFEIPMPINEVVEEFQDFTDWMDKYQMLIDLGNELAPLDEKYKNEQNLIDGCQSRVWLQCDYKDGKLVFTADSDALIVKGIIALLIRVLSGHTPSEIMDADLYFVEKIGLKDHLSPTRSNGLLAMIKQIRMYALAYKTKEAEGNA